MGIGKKAAKRALPQGPLFESSGKDTATEGIGKKASLRVPGIITIIPTYPDTCFCF